MKKGMKKVMMGALALAMMMSMGTVSYAKNATDTKKPAKTEQTAVKSQKVSKVTCTASGTVNISFKEKVDYTSEVSAVITDKNGAQMPCSIKSKTKSLLKVSTKGLVKGETYTLTIQGVKGKNADEAATISMSFVAKGMKTECKAASVKIPEKNILAVKLNTSASYKDATVEVVDADGVAYEAKIVKKSKGNIKVKVTGLKKGNTYTVTITGIKTKKEKNYSSVTKKFVVK